MPGSGSNASRTVESSKADRPMKVKRYIALVLCVLYLAATAGVALASITCKCVGMKQSRVEKACCECYHQSQFSATSICHDCLLGSRCDCELHSTEISLYTSSHSDESEKYIKCAVSELPPSLAAECPCPAHVPALRHGMLLPPVPLVREVPGRVFGLRAPPVWA